jgi:hypothetical protein
VFPEAPLMRVLIILLNRLLTLTDDAALSPSLSVTMSVVSPLSLKRCGRFLGYYVGC